MLFRSGEEVGRYSFLGVDPVAVFRSCGREIEIRSNMCCGDGVARARNQLTADFLATDATPTATGKTDVLTATGTAIVQPLRIFEPHSDSLPLT